MKIKKLFIFLLVMTFVFTLSFNMVQVFAHDGDTKTALGTGDLNLPNVDQNQDLDEEAGEDDLDENDEEAAENDRDEEDENDLDEGDVEESNENEGSNFDEGLKGQYKDDKDLNQEENKDIKLKVDDGKIKIEIEGDETGKGEGLEKIIGELEQKLKEDPYDEKSLIKLALAYKSLGDYDKVIALADETLSLNPENQKAIILLAQSYEAKGDLQSAIANLEKILNATPDAKIQAYLAILNEKEGDLKEALKNMEKAIEEAPEEDVFYDEIGKIYEKMGLEGAKLFVKGQKAALDMNPVIEDGRTLVPLFAYLQQSGKNKNPR